MIKALHAHLASLNLVDKNQIDSWIEDARLIPEGKTETVGTDDMVGVNLAYMDYNAVFLIENFSGNPTLLLALVAAWLMQNNPDRDSDEDPTFEIDPIDDKYDDVEIKLPFKEKLQIKLDPNGKIHFEGETWSLAEPVIETAEDIESFPYENPDP